MYRKNKDQTLLNQVKKQQINTPQDSTDSSKLKINESIKVFANLMVDRCLEKYINSDNKLY